MLSFLKHGNPTFEHGIHPEEHKERTHFRRILRMPFSKHYILPLEQHIGKPSVPIVRKGQKVKKGEKIAEADGMVSVALHSPVDGVVSKIGLIVGPRGVEQNAIIIDLDYYSSQQFKAAHIVDPEKLDFKEFISHVQGAGIVGLGGAAFPAHVKFSIPPGKKCESIILNGCECEPFLTSDDRLMTEHPEEVIDGLVILGKQLGVKDLAIAIEDNKPAAIEALQNASEAMKADVKVLALKTKYPQGAEKMMITALTGKEVPSGALPIDLGVLVSNVGTSVALSNYFRTGIPLIERV
ncbi:MAG: RnfABCDGE type electron transport complex subunit C, partial [Cyclobacteriaceae bacterium]|nr:RnfABCDGE type electron transport complex subunit C [Cyclobacteriaceae bacterium]